MSYLINFLLIAFSFFLPGILQKKLGPKYTATLLIFVLIHQLISLVNASIYTFSPLSMDAMRFNSYATLISQGLPPIPLDWSATSIFTYALSLFYFPPYTIITGQSISIIGYVLSAIFLRKFISYLSLDRYAVIILIAFSINPTDILNTTGVLREPWELLFTMLMSFFAIKVAIDKEITAKNLFGLLTFSFMTAITHNGLHIAAILVDALVITVFIVLPKRQKYSIGLKIAVLIATITFMLAGYYYVQMNLTSLFNQAVGYVDNIQDANTIYQVDGTSGSILWIISSWLYYMFYPFPWHINEVISLYAGTIALIHLVLLIFSIRFIGVYQKALGVLKARRLLMLLYIFLIITTIFSIGTNNYGTGLRHHILTFWILALIGIPGFMTWKHKKHENFIRHIR